MHFLKCPCLDGDAKLTDDKIQKTTAKKNISKKIKDSRNDNCEIKRYNGKSKRSGCKFRQKLKVFSVTVHTLLHDFKTFVNVLNVQL
jgi:hypothetical protein